MSTFRTHLLATAAGIAMSAGFASASFAATPSYTINPDAIPGTVNGGITSVTVDSIVDSSTALIQASGGGATGTKVTETGILNFDQFRLGGTGQPNTGLYGFGISYAPSAAASVSGSYGLYFSFTAVNTLSAPFGTAQFDPITSLTGTLFADPGVNDVITPAVAGAAGPGTAPSITNPGGTDLAIGVVDSARGSSSSAGFTGTSPAGLFFNANVAFGLCDGTAGEALFGTTKVSDAATATCGTFDGTKFFTSPSPFYSLALSQQGVPGGTYTIAAGGGANPNVAIAPNSPTVSVNFQNTPVPEPASLILFGSGLLGLGAAMRRRKKQQQS